MGEPDAPALSFGPAHPWGSTWIASTPRAMRRASHALVADGRVWLIDPVDGDGLDEHLAGLGRVAGVVQLLDRHGRDCAALAARHDVPHHENPLRGVPGAPFIPIALTQRRWWREVALWWPGHRALVVAEAVGTSAHVRAPGRRVGVHPALRLTPPRVLTHLAPAVLLVGHGAPLSDGDVAGDLHHAVRHSRRELPRWVAGLPRAGRRANADPDPHPTTTEDRT